MSSADVLVSLSLLSIGVGCWMAWPPLGLIVPGVIVFGCMAISRLRGGG